MHLNHPPITYLVLLLADMHVHSAHRQFRAAVCVDPLHANAYPMPACMPTVCMDWHRICKHGIGNRLGILHTVGMHPGSVSMTLVLSGMCVCLQRGTTLRHRPKCMLGMYKTHVQTACAWSLTVCLPCIQCDSTRSRRPLQMWHAEYVFSWHNAVFRIPTAALRSLHQACSTLTCATATAW